MSILDASSMSSLRRGWPDVHLSVKLQAAHGTSEISGEIRQGKIAALVLGMLDNISQFSGVEV